MSEKGEKAKALFLQGYNCAQAVVGAFAEELGLDFDMAAKLGYSDPKATVEKKELYQEIQRIAEQFRKENGSIVCAELLAGVKDADNSPIPSARTKDYYQKRPCAELAACAAEILEGCTWIR